ncbi:ECF RNA polymerase sigma factor SigW [Paenibacillus sp. J31TS4]|uniref:RNA polymerase sigma factor n=1 Tax=Paenibacillus sp. J31TS4 TaxID=2807195 RepID=UPI001B288FC4|nr:RNA polymerase sigma factor [Paenibacillus sp. J31TS4]GIP40542.1 ECF RNA polymerase sigma factor SigW [Paenibacillus sp. J31TS4]
MKTDRELFEAYKQDVYKLCWYMTSNRADAEDLCQEAFVKALGQDRSRVVEEKAWLLRIAANLCRNHYRRKKNGIQKEIRSFLLMRPAPPERPEDRVERRELSDEFARRLEKLPEKLRAAITLRYGNGLRLEEVAAVLEIPLGTVKSRIHKGLAQLRIQMEAQPSYTRKGEKCYE